MSHYVFCQNDYKVGSLVILSLVPATYWGLFGVRGKDKLRIILKGRYRYCYQFVFACWHNVSFQWQINQFRINYLNLKPLRDHSIFSPWDQMLSPWWSRVQARNLGLDPDPNDLSRISGHKDNISGLIVVLFWSWIAISGLF